MLKIYLLPKSNGTTWYINAASGHLLQNNLIDDSDPQLMRVTGIVFRCFSRGRLRVPPLTGKMQGLDHDIRLR